MVKVILDPFFKKKLEKIKDSSLREKVKKQIRKIVESPLTGKPMMYDRKGTREIYVAPYRLSYIYFSEKEELWFLDLYHKDEQ